jgi:hypothetical protein
MMLAKVEFKHWQQLLFPLYIWKLQLCIKCFLENANVLMWVSIILNSNRNIRWFIIIILVQYSVNSFGIWLFEDVIIGILLVQMRWIYMLLPVATHGHFPSIYINSNYSCLLHALLLFTSISIHWCHPRSCFHPLVPSLPCTARACLQCLVHIVSSQLLVLITSAHLCHLSPQRATYAYHNAFGEEEIKKLTFQKCCSLFLKSWICFIHMKLKENIECY